MARAFWIARNARLVIGIFSGLNQSSPEKGQPDRANDLAPLPNPDRPAMIDIEDKPRLSPSPDKGLDRGFMFVLFVVACAASVERPWRFDKRPLYPRGL